jgi:hypothetical protein
LGEKAHIHFAANVGGEEALEKLEAHASWQRLQGNIGVGPLVKAARLHQRPIHPDGGAGGMPSKRSAKQSPAAVGKCPIPLLTTFTFFGKQPHALMIRRNRRFLLEALFVKDVGLHHRQFECAPNG